MSKKANKTLIGVFVLGAVALLFIAVLVFGSGKFFKQRPSYVLFFEGSLKGLSVGSQVAYRGIPIGEVTGVDVLLDRERAKVLIPVYIELDPDRFTVVGEGVNKPKVLDKKGQQQFVNRLIKTGFRAQLQMQSLVSGQVMINLDLFPNKPVRLVGADPRHIEVPTVPTDIQDIGRTAEKVIATLQRIPLEQLVENLSSAAKGLDKLANGAQMQKSLDTLNQMLANMHVLVQSVNKQVGPMAERFRATTEAAIAALKQAQRTLATAENIADGNSPLGHQLTATLQELTAAASSLRGLADTLERRPDALLRGKSE